MAARAVRKIEAVRIAFGGAGSMADEHDVAHHALVVAPRLSNAIFYPRLVAKTRRSSSRRSFAALGR